MNKLLNKYVIFALFCILIIITMMVIKISESKIGLYDFVIYNITKT